MGLLDFFKGKNKKTAQKATENSIIRDFHSLRIEEVVQETADAISVYLAISKEMKITFDFKAGQYITLRVNKDEQQYLRSYSLSSCPISDTYYRIAIKRKKGGAISGHLVDNLKRGDQLAVFPPLGSFTPQLTEGSQKNYCLFAGGSGITPLLSIAKYLLSQNAAEKVILVYANRNQQQIIYQKEINNLQKKYGEKFLVHHILDEVTEDWTGLKGIFKAKDYANLLASKYVSEYKNVEYFICGPDLMMQEVEQALKTELDIDSQQIYIEYFTMEKQPNDTKEQLNRKVKDESETELTDGDTSASIILHQKTHQLVIPKGKTILEATLDAGIDAPYMCEAGVCSTCRARLLKGKVNMLACYALNDKEVEEGYILTCQSVPETATIEVSFD